MSYSSDYNTLSETIEIICKTFVLWIKPLFYLVGKIPAHSYILHEFNVFYILNQLKKLSKRERVEQYSILMILNYLKNVKLLETYT